jgi:diguanylate cyclase (GGDEF)-like protein
MPSLLRQGHLLTRTNRAALIAALVLLVIAVVCLDQWTGQRFALKWLLIPIVSLAAWHFGLRVGIGFAVLASMLGVLVDYLSGRDAPASALSVGIAQWTGALVRLGVFAFVAWVLARLRASLDEQRRLAEHDSLTGLANRQSLFARGTEVLDNARRKGASVSAIFVDCDQFKAINDRWGHARGDELLCEVANCLRAVGREKQIVARLGGDEFVIVETGGTAAQTADLAERLQAQFADRMQARSCPLTLSIGAVWFGRPLADLDQLIAAADEAMYAVKRGAKGGIEFRRIEQEFPVRDQASEIGAQEAKA